MTKRFCADCIHLAPWPERAERAVEVFGCVPMGHPVHACMADPDRVLAVSPEDAPACCVSAASECARFERGNRSRHYKEV